MKQQITLLKLNEDFFTSAFKLLYKTVLRV